METPEYTSSCAITQKIKPANVRVVKISQCTPIPKIQLGSIKFWIWPRAYSQPQALLRNDIQTVLVGAFDALSSFSDAIPEVCPIHSAVYQIVNTSTVFYLFTVLLSYQAFNYLIILHWAQLKHNGLCRWKKSNYFCSCTAVGLLLCTWNKWDSVLLWM